MQNVSIETRLIQGLSVLRATEADVARSLNDARTGGNAEDLRSKFYRMQAQMTEVESLLAAIETNQSSVDVAYTDIRALSGAQINSAVV